MVDQHTVRAYDKDLDLLERRIAEMGGLAEKMVIDVVDALFRRRRARPSGGGDRSAARPLAARDRGAGDADDRAPAAGGDRLARDHRPYSGCGRSRAGGDLAKNIARRSVKIGVESRVPRAIIGISTGTSFVTELMKDVLDAYAQRDVERALDVWERDVELDALEDLVFRDS